MSSFDKTVKRACKPKPFPPKAKYVDPLIAATYSEVGAVHDVCKALSPRFREPNAIVVFKALILLHTMIRNGATDNILNYLSGSDVLHLHNVYSGQWEGYNAPQNLQRYAAYLDARIRTYKELKHDPVKVQSESNRDMRLDNSIEGEVEQRGERSGSHRSKTITGRKLRVMTVEKGLLRETKSVLKVIEALLDCRFYLDSLEDELNLTALRMLVKDLLVLFQAVNEGVINVLEHYFEMSHVDAEQALALYKSFCKQTERVVDYLTVAKKLSNLLNVQIPNLKHAPVSLVKSLEEYLKDPNFEQNRLEYRNNKASADKSEREGSKSSKSQASKPTATPVTPAKTSTTSATGATQPSTSKADANKALVDFFTSIEEEQPTIFNPQTGSPTNTYFRSQAAHNPFNYGQTGVPTNAFASPPFAAQQPFQQPNAPFPTSNDGFNPYANVQPPQPQQPAFGNFLQTQPLGGLQAPGFNPFRQSILVPPTGPSPFGNGSILGGVGTPGLVSSPPPFSPGPSITPAPFFSQPQQLTGSVQGSPFGQSNTSGTIPDFGQFSISTLNGQGIPARPASTPATTFNQQNQPVSRNPFGIPRASSPPPMPKPPTLSQLASGAVNGQPNVQQQAQGIANNSHFSDANRSATANSTPTSTTAPSSILSSFSDFSSFSGQSNGTTATTVGTGGVPSISSPAPTNNAGGGNSSVPSFALTPSPSSSLSGLPPLKPFKPTSSFGLHLLESLPPIQESTPSGTLPNTQNQSTGQPTQTWNPTGANTQGVGAPTAQSTLLNAPLGGGGLNSSLGVGLRPQSAAGFSGAANPFRASSVGPPSGVGGQPFSSAFSPGGALPSFGASQFQGGLNGGLNQLGGQNSTTPIPQQFHNGVSSLI